MKIYNFLHNSQKGGKLHNLNKKMEQKFPPNLTWNFSIIAMGKFSCVQHKQHKSINSNAA
jgi:hypothetical protein